MGGSAAPGAHAARGNTLKRESGRMDILTGLRESLTDAWSALVAALASHLPALLGAIALLVVGWFAARLLRALVLRLTRLLDGLIQHFYLRRGLEPPRHGLASGRVLGELIFWVVILFFLTAAMHVLGVVAFTEWMNRVLAYLPTLVVGGIIILAGFLVSVLARDLVVAATPLPPPQRLVVGRSVQFVILITAIVIGADQVGINVTFLIIMTAVVAASLLGGLAAAMSLGARGYVANLIGTRQLRESYRVGQTIRIGGHQGVILEFTPVAIVLETAEGRLTLPGRLASEEPILLLMGDGDGQA